ncbi:ABC transporter substrate-binding protein [Microbacterium soli]|uniref:ABC transporter substrate-binding protein n=1 Tax=Microbacterium soli TaxID=446075 RepID=A0ABP7N4N7_9MICO
MKDNRRRTAALAIATLTAVLLAGCASAVEQAESSGDGEATDGGTLTIVQSADISPNTMFSQNNPNMSVERAIFNSLVQYDHKTLEPLPELATSWTLSDDGTQITFALRDDVTFHDGRAFTADDVLASIDTLLRPEVPSQTKHIAAEITEKKAVDDHTVQITFGKAMSNYMDLFLMMPIIDGTDPDGMLSGKNMNGTGPFKVESYSPGQGADLVKNDDYWVKGAPHLDGVRFTVVRDSQSMLSSLKAGQSQLALDLSPLDAASIEDQPGFDLVRSDANDSAQYIGSSVSVPVLKDKRVRQAISYAIDRERILEQVDGGIGTVTALPWAESSPAYDADKANHFERDIDKAKSLLSEAGADGESVKIYFNSGFPPSAGMAEVIEYDLQEAGLKPVLMPLQASDFTSRLQGAKFDGLFLAGHGFGQLHPATLIKGAFPFNADKNASGFDSDEYRALADKIWQSSGDIDQATYDQVNEFLLDQQFVSDLVLSTHTYAISDSLKGLDETMLDYLILDEAYLQK